MNDSYGKAAGTAPPISVCIIAHREERRIGNCLDSVRSIARQIVVVVQDPEDPTIEVARSHGAEVHVRPWRGFVAQKNHALDLAREPWILALDADERPDEELLEALSQLVATPGTAYRMRRVDRFLGRYLEHGETGRFLALRLFPRGGARFGGGLVHEHLEHDGPVRTLPGRLLHHSNESAHAMSIKLHGYARLWVAQWVRRRKRPPALAEVLARPGWRFFRSYVLRRGFLDGYAGYVHARILAEYTFHRYHGLREYARSERWREEVDTLLGTLDAAAPARSHGLDRFRG